MLSENSQLSAHSLELDAGGTQVDADGDIRHLLPRSGNEPQAKPGSPGAPAGAEARQKSGTKSSPILVQSAHLKYLKEQNSIHYTGNVIMQSEDARMTADAVDVTFGAEGKVEKAAAHGRLHIVQEGRDIRGLEGDYDLALGRFVVTGNPAEITDPAKGKSVAHRLTFFTADDRILLGH